MRATVLLVVSLCCAAPALADGFIVPVSERDPFRGAWAVKEHFVRIDIAGQEARTEVRQTFVNLTDRPLEVQYLFPVPEGAMLKSLTLVVGDRSFTGRILPVEEARRIYEEIVRQKRDPAILSYAGRALVQGGVFPLPARGEREVIVRYDELLPRDAGAVKLVYPLDTERFSARRIGTVEVRVDIRDSLPVRSVYSPSHPLRVEYPERCRAVATFTEKDSLPDRDLVLYYGTDEREVGATVLTFFPPGADAGHFLLLLSPGALDPGREPLPKDLVLVLDHSGSMQGGKIAQAKEALRNVLQSLSPRDRVNLVAFASTARSLFAAPRELSPEVRREALQFVETIEATGGTDIGSALDMALAGLAAEPGRERAVLFLTDGLPTVGVQDTAEIVRAVAKGNSGPGARLFVFGVGYDVNAAFLDRLVEENGGVSENVLPDENVEIAVSGLWRKIRNTALSGLSVRIDGVPTHDLYPRRLPDLFEGSQLVVAGRYAKGGEATVVLDGRTSGGPRTFRFAARFPDRTDEDSRPFVARVYATMKIGYLIDQMRLLGRREPELVDEIVKLSERYGILTEYTAFLADDTNDFRDLPGNSAAARRDLEEKLGQVTGGSGSNQALNTKRLRAQQHAEGRNFWNDEDGRVVEVSSVRSVGRKVFYRRGGVWMDREATGEPVETVRQWSERYFDLVRGQTAAQNEWFALDGPVLLEIGGRIVKILPPE
ncbi:MAG: VIT and VWA domain-containing protein [Planctomycetes bacterium]|nr:VIT and VWA domain-containing protein [Planctomycetota bacterium]